jgi:hypothetical protein
MSRYATATDFFNGPLYTEYVKFTFFAQRADWILARWPQAAGAKVAVIGCGPGAYLVEELVARGVNAYGIDGYRKNVNHGIVTVQPTPAIAARCVLDADFTNNSDVGRFRSLAGLSGNQRFYLAVSEDVLPCLTTQEINVAVANMQSRSDRNLHIITCNRSGTETDPGRTTSLGLQWLTQAAWRSAINAAGGSTHIGLDAETWEVF